MTDILPRLRRFGIVTVAQRPHRIRRNGWRGSTAIEEKQSHQSFHRPPSLLLAMRFGMRQLPHLS